MPANKIVVYVNKYACVFRDRIEEDIRKSFICQLHAENALQTRKLKASNKYEKSARFAYQQKPKIIFAANKMERQNSKWKALNKITGNLHKMRRCGQKKKIINHKNCSNCIIVTVVVAVG